MSNANVVNEFINQVNKQRPSNCNEAYTLGYLLSFVENSMTPTMKKKMERHTEFLKTLTTE